MLGEIFFLLDFSNMANMHFLISCYVLLSHSSVMAMKTYMGFILQENSVGTMSSHCRFAWCYDFRLEPEVIFVSAAIVCFKKFQMLIGT